MKIISMLLIILLLMPGVSFSEDLGLFFAKDVVSTIHADITYQVDTIDKQKELLSIKGEQLDLSVNEARILKELSEKQKQDLLVLTSTVADCRNSYVESDKALGSCRDSKPSRLIWFSAGALTTALLAVIVMVAAGGN